MARVKYGSIITEIRGKLGSHVFQKCGQSLSMRTQQSNVFSPSQSGLNAQNLFVNLAYQWKTLDSSYQSTFSDNANTYPTKDKWGNTIVLTGYQMYIYINRVLVACGLPPKLICSVYSTLVSRLVSIGSYNFDGNTFPINFSSTDSATKYYIFYISKLYQGSCKVHNPKTKYLFSQTITSVTSINLFTIVQDFYRNQIVYGNAFYLEVWQLDSASGISSYVSTTKVSTAN